MESLAHRDIEQLTGALRQLSNEIAEAVNGNVAAGREAESPSSAYLDVGREVGEAAEGILEREEAERLERIIAENNLLPVHFLEEGANVQRAVARVVRNDGAMGSGFLVSRNLFMTNNHVLPSAQIAGGARAEFNFQYDYNGNPRSPDVYRFEPASLYYTNVNLDMSLVRLSPSGSTHAGTRWGRIALRRSVGYARGQHLNIVQHPRGRRKEVALQENRITNVYQNAIRYTTDTEQGSSGSPVFNNGWDVVALHHSGGERRGTVWINNEGIRIDRIVEALRSHFGGSAGGAAILSDLGI